MRGMGFAMALAACAREPVPSEHTTTGRLTSSTADTASLAPPHNVLVVLLDDVGVDGIAAYGVSPDPPVTPTLDRLVDEGVRFTRAYGYPVCSPSRAALLTGRYGRRHGVGNNVRWNTDAELPLAEITLAEIAREAGYATGIFGKWHLAGRDGVGIDPQRQGFDRFVGMAGNFGANIEDWGPGPFDYSRWERITDGTADLVVEYAPSVVVDATLAWVREQPGPWFAYVAMPTAHGPMHVPPETLQSTGVMDGDPPHDLFRAVVEAGDRELGRLLAGLDDETIDNTVVMVAGDNGTDANRDAPAFAVLGGKSSIYEGGIRVPLVVWGPVVATPGEAHEGLVHLVDVAPTVAELVQAPEVPALDGQTLLPFVREPTRTDGRDLLYNEYFGPVGPGPWVIDWRMAIGRDLKVVEAVHFEQSRVMTLGPSPADEVQFEIDELSNRASEVAELQDFLAATTAELGL